VTAHEHPRGTEHDLLEAVGRALGARRALLIVHGTRLPRLARAWWRPEVHRLVVDVPDTSPPRQLVLELPRPPAVGDLAVAQALARAFESPRQTRPEEHRTTQAFHALEVLRSMSARPGPRPEALLRGTLRMVRAPAGAVVTVDHPPEVWTIGGGRAVLHRAAIEGTQRAGVVNLGGRRFWVRPLEWDGSVVGGLAVEDAEDSPELRACAGALAAVLRTTQTEEVEAGSSREPDAAARDLFTALSVLPLPALAVDATGRLIVASPAAEDLFALTDFDLGEPVARRLRVLGVEGVLRGGEVPHEVLVDDQWFEPVAVALPSGGHLFLLLDRSIEESLREAQERLVAAMSHELRTPVAGVKALLEMLRLPGSRKDETRLENLLREGIREIERLERLVEDLLLAARVTTGGISSHPDEVQLRPVVEDVVRQIQQRFPDRTFDVTGDVSALADPALVRHALRHLIENAAKFGEAGSHVRIVIGEGAGFAKVEIHDRGPGIFSGDIPDLFGPFKRLDRRQASQHGGAGIGLYLVKAVIEAQDGKVEVRSRLGKGSTFSFRLPRPKHED
jgi:signal transduction histidine kinase